MEIGTIVIYVLLGIVGIMMLIGIGSSFFTIPQGNVGVITRFGKYKRVALPGLGFKTPFLDTVFDTVSIQSQASELAFQAITIDQANVYFKAMILYAVANSNDDNIQLVAFKFADTKDFATALTKSIEASVRSLVATKKQSEVLSIRQEMVDWVKNHLDAILLSWGYHLSDVQINDITFDSKITSSMADVVASSNLKAAAENEGNALLITKTKAAEAEGNAIRISAQAEKEAAKLRGEGVAAFRAAVSAGIALSAQELKDQGIGTDVIMFSMWTEAIKNFAEVGKGNMIFLDGSVDGMERSMKAMLSKSNGKVMVTN